MNAAAWGVRSTLDFGRCVFQWMSARALYDRLLALAPSEAKDLDGPYLSHDKPNESASDD